MRSHTIGTERSREITSDIVCGTVASVSPLTVSVGRSLTLPSSSIYIPASVLSDIHSGSVLLMIRGAGGDRYAVIGIL